MVYDFKVGRTERYGPLVMRCRQVDIRVEGHSVKDCMEVMVRQIELYQGNNDPLPAPSSDEAWAAFSDLIEEIENAAKDEFRSDMTSLEQTT